MQEKKAEVNVHVGYPLLIMFNNLRPLLYLNPAMDSVETVRIYSSLHFKARTTSSVIYRLHLSLMDPNV